MIFFSDFNSSFIRLADEFLIYYTPSVFVSAVWRDVILAIISKNCFIFQNKVFWLLFGDFEIPSKSSNLLITIF